MTSQQQQRSNADGGASSGAASSKSAVGGVIQQRDSQVYPGQHPLIHATFESSRVPFPQTLSRSATVEQLDGSTTHNEDNLINELKSEK